MVFVPLLPKTHAETVRDPADAPLISMREVLRVVLARTSCVSHTLFVPVEQV
jgi:hypothetical protein